jgi:hypothetical protein
LRGVASSARHVLDDGGDHSPSFFRMRTRGQQRRRRRFRRVFSITSRVKGRRRCVRHFTRAAAAAARGVVVVFVVFVVKVVGCLER